jgi:membrane fusion protein (multidrug efflux system)
MFVTAHLEEGFVEDGILVPQQGVTHDPQGQATALIVTPDNKVELRTLTTSRAIGNKWLISSGLQAGDRVIIDGLQKAHPGATVHPIAATTETAPTAPQP